MVKLSNEQYQELAGLLEHDPSEDGEWAIVNNSNGPCIYAVNSRGTIVVRLSCTDKRGYKQKPRKCFIRTFPDGYLFCNLNDKDVRLHRLMAATWLDDWDESLTVNHKDGNKCNNSIENLEMMTVHDNCMYYHTADCIKEQRKRDYAHHGDTIRGRIHITNGTEAKMIYPEDGIPEGWWRGRPQSMKDQESASSKGLPGPNAGKIMITDGTTIKYVSSLKDIPSGWRRGGVALKLSEEQRVHRSQVISGRIYITRNKVNKRVHLEELDTYLTDGWRIGRYSKR